MVLDCGGGTVDITTHRCLSKLPFRLQEVAHPEGGGWGSTYVDAQFGLFLQDLLGDGRYADIQKTPSCLDLMVRDECSWAPARACLPADFRALTRQTFSRAEILGGAQAVAARRRGGAAQPVPGARAGGV